jgi:DNA-binding NtrC family response regulator
VTHLEADHFDTSLRLLPPAADQRGVVTSVFPLLILVEGNVRNRLQIANDLLDEGYEVVEAEHPGEAMSILKGRDDFDGMIADIYFGGLSSDLALLRYMASERKGTSVLVLTDCDEEKAAVAATGARFLKRPCSTKALLRSVAEMLSLKAIDVSSRIQSLEKRPGGAWWPAEPASHFA